MLQEFGKNKNVDAHIANIHPLDKCIQCDFSSTAKESMKVHMKEKHNFTNEEVSSSKLCNDAKTSKSAPGNFFEDVALPDFDLNADVELSAIQTVSLADLDKINIKMEKLPFEDNITENNLLI